MRCVTEIERTEELGREREGIPSWLPKSSSDTNQMWLFAGTPPEGGSVVVARETDGIHILNVDCGDTRLGICKDDAGAEVRVGPGDMVGGDNAGAGVGEEGKVNDVSKSTQRRRLGRGVLILNGGMCGWIFSEGRRVRPRLEG